MKKILLPLILLLLASSVNAQYVNIPDSNFRNFLMVKYPACFNASKQMDTTCGGIVNETQINCSSLYISSINGIQYFDSLETLVCNDNSLTIISKLPQNLLSFTSEANYNLSSLPALPIKLKKLVCRFSKISTLPILPNTLEIIDLNHSQLTSLPTSLPNNLSSLDVNSTTVSILPPLPNTLTSLDCGRSWVSILPPLPITLKILLIDNSAIQVNTINLPSNLTHFSCSNCNYSSLPILPATLYLLDVSGNNLTSLPTPLPTNLTDLYCSDNKLTNLPTLPNGLEFLVCYNNLLTSLPKLPDGLFQLRCYNNLLTSLPVLPDGLENLLCNNNQLTSLPTLPSSWVFNLDCSQNDIYCLPHLPKSLANAIYFSFDTSKIKCIPNPVAGFNYPVCNAINNVNGCQNFGFANVKGRVFYDANSNGVKDSLEVYSNNTKVSFAGLSSVITNNDNFYNFATDSLATYTLTPTTPIANTAFNPSFAAITFNKIDTVITQNFAIQPTAIKDSLQIILTTSNATRAGGFISFQIDVKNAGTTNLTNVSSVLNYGNTKVVFDTCKPFAFVDNGSSITLNLPTIPFGGHYTYYGYFTTKTSVAIGDTIKLNATVSNGILLENAIAKTIVRGSFDPNDKTATPELSTTQVAEGKKIDYTIRFQNTGNDTAIHVVIADTLDSNLDFSSIQIIATSHNCKTTIKDNIIYFEMRDIMLLDSGVNNIASNGFIRFLMQPKNTVVAGDNIPNKAAIYFDYNAAVITNTAITQIKNPLLPVKISSYELKFKGENKILNSWLTSAEINTSHFVVQRSNDGRIFKSVGAVAASGNGTYNFIDELKATDHLLNVLYYRLQSIDKDGSSSFSEVKQIRLNQLTNQTINIFPNPAKTFASIDCRDAREIFIANNLGKIVYQSNTNNSPFIISLTSFSKGIYFVKIVTNRGDVKTEKLVIE